MIVITKRHRHLQFWAFDQLGELVERMELLVLARFQGLKYEQIAALLDLEVGTVKVRIHRAVADLREIVLKMSGEEERCVVTKPEGSSRTT